MRRGVGIALGTLLACLLASFAFSSTPLVGISGSCSSGQLLVWDGSGVACSTSAGLAAFPFGAAGAYSQQFLNVNVNNSGAGDIDLYTVPSGKRLVVYGIGGYNSTGSPINAYPQVKRGGVYYQMGSATGFGANATNGLTVSFILEAGDILSVNTASSGINLFGSVALFSNTAPLKTILVTSLAAGDNTIYTVPASSSAILIFNAVNFPGPTSTALYYSNASGTSRTILWHIVTSGGSPGTTNRASPNASATTVTTGTFALANRFSATLGAGDFINLNVDANTATQFAWVNVLEIANP